jgi:hypothetical protein
MGIRADRLRFGNELLPRQLSDSVALGIHQNNQFTGFTSLKGGRVFYGVNLCSEA